MKITFPILTLCKGGAQRMLAELANGLVRRGHDVTIIMPTYGDLEYDIICKLIRTPGYEFAETDYPISDVIVSNFYTIIPSAQAASDNGKGTHVRLSLCYEPTFLPENHVTFRTYHMPNLLVLSKWQQQMIYLNHGVKGHIVPVGISSTFKNFHIRSPHDSLQISAIIRIPEGGYSWHREQEYLIEQLELVKQLHPEVIINLLCPPKELASSLQLQQLKNNCNFRFLTPENDAELCYHYNYSDIFVSSSTYDTAGLPGLEAMKCGAALVTTYSGGNLDYCRHEENCLLSYRYENRLSQDILRLIRDTDLRTRLALAGEQEAAKWTWENSVNAFEEGISQILQKSR
ncbi:glycosyltransferase family 4 protein [Bacillus sp. BRMEA1]|uniref:glycosyltransferase family 4 protein n=1 Tax=Neobacillus endophyticus TaxID=2738405 RepID=UPI0015653687|nr:glycosyltransferase family 4 protein [Neobacillus endophyticus]NRD76721.1 glycosyltransferase family 4 protein [Neobacillus endophyticus]